MRDKTLDDLILVKVRDLDAALGRDNDAIQRILTSTIAELTYRTILDLESLHISELVLSLQNTVQNPVQVATAQSIAQRLLFLHAERVRRAR